MFRSIVKNQYIGKSKLKFIYYDNILADDSKFDAIGYPLIVPGPYHHYPDWVVFGYFDPEKLTFKRVGLEKRKKESLYITGIPKGVPSIDPWRLDNVIWSSYYEDDYRGYLFQIVNSNEPLNLINLQLKS